MTSPTPDQEGTRLPVHDREQAKAKVLRLLEAWRLEDLPVMAERIVDALLGQPAWEVEALRVNERAWREKSEAYRSRVGELEKRLRAVEGAAKGTLERLDGMAYSTGRYEMGGPGYGPPHAGTLRGVADRLRAVLSERED